VDEEWQQKSHADSSYCLINIWQAWIRFIVWKMCANDDQTFKYLFDYLNNTAYTNIQMNV
jgi:hypothetical protein